MIAVAPGAFIDKSLCKKVYHLVCKGDVVPLLDVKGMVRCGDTIQFLNPIPGESLHSFNSKVYTADLAYRCKAFLKDYQ